MLPVLRMLLAAVFATAGAAKLVDREGSAEAARGFGTPERFARLVGVGLPLVELAVAVGLVVTATVTAAAGAALVLLGVFCVAIGAAMRRGEAPDCHCFGQVSSSPAGPATLARNAGLAAVAIITLVAALSGHRPSATHWVTTLSSAEAASVAVAAGALVVALVSAWFARELLRSHGRLLLRLDDLEAFAGGAAGAPAEHFELPDTTGRTRSLGGLLALGRPVVLIFSDAKCGPCRALMPLVAGWQSDLKDRATIAVVATGDPAVLRAEAQEHGLQNVLLAPDRGLHVTFDAAGTPTAVRIGPDGSRVGRSAGGKDAIERLIAALPAAAGGQAPLHVIPPRAPAGPQPGTPAPALSLPLAGGGTFTLDGPPGSPTLLVFWNPGCGFCRSMTEPLRETAAREDAPRIVLVARGDEQANLSLDPGVPVALDHDGAAADAYGARGTPTGVLVDADGRVASHVAVGANATLGLA